MTFVREAARRSGLTLVDFPKLMKKPSGYLRAVIAAQPQAVTVIERTGKEYLATLPPIDGVVPVDAPVSTPGNRD